MTNFREGSPLNKRQKLIRGAAIFIASHGGISAPPAAEVTPFLDMTTSEQMATIVTDAGKAADDISSADDLVKEGEAIYHQLTSEADAHPSPETNPDGDDTKTLLDLEGDREKEKKKKAEEDLALGDGEEVSSGNIIAPASPDSGESTAADQQRADVDQQRAEAAADVDQQRAEAAADVDQQRAEAAAEADQERAEAAARTDEEIHQQAAAEDEERFGCPAEESEPADETWLEDDANVNDPDIE
jgi:hypothetical protein